MPRFLEQKLQRKYPNNPRAVYGTLNDIGAMCGNKETPKGAAMQATHDATKGRKSAAAGQHPNRNLGKFLHAKRKP